MKCKIRFLLLVCVVTIFFVSCNSSESFYKQGNYRRVVSKVDSIKLPSKNDYLMKIKALYALDKIKEARESIVLYLLSAKPEDERKFVVELFLREGFSDALTVLLLDESDGIDAQVALFKSYVALNQTDKAKEILFGSLSAALELTQFAELLVTYINDEKLILSFFKSWFELVTEEEAQSFLQNFEIFVKKEISEQSIIECLKIANAMEGAELFRESGRNLARVYKLKGLLCESLYDTTNSVSFFQKSYVLNPNDFEVRQKLNK